MPAENLPSRAFKGVWIPRSLWLNKKLTWLQKCVLAEVDSLAESEKRPCTASNEYFAGLFDVSTGRMANIISELRQAGWIKTVSFDGKFRGIIAAIERPVFTETVKAKAGAGFTETVKAGFTETVKSPNTIGASGEKEEQKTVASAPDSEASPSKPSPVPAPKEQPPIPQPPQAKQANPVPKFIALWCEAWKAAKGGENYTVTGRDAGQLKLLFRASRTETPESLVGLAIKAWAGRGWNCTHRTGSISDFVGGVNQIRAELKTLGVTRGPDFNIGTENESAAGSSEGIEQIWMRKEAARKEASRMAA